ncbi:MAG TPA: Crp/Fnr family transcriptional regulator [Rhizomicrobium sp.]|jgi:CRP-like cAMP-binding protein|nr:Crp/Fnr family transcriptional regulator [Rhizomicrobium sp.]
MTEPSSARVSPSSALRLFLNGLLSRSTLSEEAQASVLDLPGTLAEIRRNEDFVSVGRLLNHACLVVDGLAARWGQARDGERQITALHIAGDMPDLHSLVLPVASFGLQALSPTTILRVPHAALRKAALHPDLAEAFWRTCTLDAAIASEWLVNIGCRNAKSRIAHFICEMATRFGVTEAGNAFAFSLPVTQHHLAEATGLSVVHVNRSLQSLKRDRLAVLIGHDIQVLDWDGLQAAADFDAAYLHLGRRTREPALSAEALPPRMTIAGTIKDPDR